MTTAFTKIETDFLQAQSDLNKALRPTNRGGVGVVAAQERLNELTSQLNASGSSLEQIQTKQLARDEEFAKFRALRFEQEKQAAEAAKAATKVAEEQEQNKVKMPDFVQEGEQTYFSINDSNSSLKRDMLGRDFNHSEGTIDVLYNGVPSVYVPKSFAEKGYLATSSGQNIWHGSTKFLNPDIYQYMKPARLDESFVQKQASDRPASSSSSSFKLSDVPGYTDGYIISQDVFNKTPGESKFLDNPAVVPQGMGAGSNGKPAYVGLKQDTSGYKQGYELLSVGAEGSPMIESQYSKSIFNAVPELKLVDLGLRIYFPAYNLGRAVGDYAFNDGKIGDVALAVIAMNMPGKEGATAAQGTFLEIPQIASATSDIANFYQAQGLTAAQATAAAKVTLDTGLSYMAEGGNLGDAFTRAAATYVGSEAAKTVVGFMRPLSADIAKITGATTQATTRAMLLNEDVSQAAKRAFITTAVPMAVDGAIKESGLKISANVRSAAINLAAQSALNPNADVNQILRKTVQSTLTDAVYDQVKSEAIKNGTITANNTEALDRLKNGIKEVIDGKDPSQVLIGDLVDMAKSSAKRELVNWLDESTFDSNELAETYKAVYGKEPTKEWLASDEAFDMLGRSDAQAKSLLQNLHKKETTEAAPPDLPKSDLTLSEADQLRADLGLPPVTQPGPGTQLAGSNTGVVSDAGGGPSRDDRIQDIGSSWIARNYVNKIEQHAKNRGLDPDKWTAEQWRNYADAFNLDLTQEEKDAIYLETERLYDAGNLVQDSAVQDLFNRPVPKTLSPQAPGLEGKQEGKPDDDFWKSIGINPSTFTDSSPSLSNDEIMALIGYGQAATPPVDGSGKPIFGSVSGEFGGGPLTGFTLVSEANGAKVYENDGFTLIARANGSSVLLDKADPNPEPIWLDPVDAAKLVQPTPAAPPVTPPVSTPEPTPTVDDLIKELTPVTPVPAPTPAPTPTPEPALTPAPTSAPAPEPTPAPTPGPTPQPNPEQTPAPTPTPTPSPEQTPAPTPTPTPPTANVTPSEVEKIVSDALKANPSLTADDVRKIVSDAVATVPNLTADQVKNIVGAEVAKVPVGATPQDVQKVVDASAATQGAATAQAIADAKIELAKEIQAAKDIGLQGDVALQAGLDSMAAKMGVNQAEVLKQLGTSTDALRKEFGAGLADVTAAQKTQYDALTAAQKAETDARIAQGQTLQDAIAATKTATTGQIADLGAKTTEQYNTLTAAQKAEADARVAQGQSLQDAISGVSGKVTGLEGQLTAQGKAFADQLVQQGMDYKTAMQTAIDAQTAMFGTQIGNVQSQLAAAEAARQADLAAQIQREQAAAAEAARQGKIANVRSTLARGQQTFQQAAQQLPQTYRQAQETTAPIYGQMGEYLDLGTPLDVGFFKPSAEKQAATKQQQPTKIAAGGYIDDLLAGDMTADDLLNLLR